MVSFAPLGPRSLLDSAQAMANLPVNFIILVLDSVEPECVRSMTTSWHAMLQIDPPLENGLRNGLGWRWSPQIKGKDASER